MIADSSEMLRGEQKAVATCAELIQRYSFPGALVVDMFTGTGSTAVASMLLGRKFVGSDIDADVVNAAKKRCVELMTKSSIYDNVYRKHLVKLKNWRSECLANGLHNPETKFTTDGGDEHSSDFDIAKVLRTYVGYVMICY